MVTGWEILLQLAGVLAFMAGTVLMCIVTLLLLGMVIAPRDTSKLVKQWANEWRLFIKGGNDNE